MSTDQNKLVKNVMDTSVLVGLSAGVRYLIRKKNIERKLPNGSE